MLRLPSAAIKSQFTQGVFASATGLTGLDSTTKLAIAAWFKMENQIGTTASAELIGQWNSAGQTDGYSARFTTRNGFQIRTFNGAANQQISFPFVMGRVSSGMMNHWLVWLDQVAGIAQFYLNGFYMGQVAVATAWTAAGTRKTIIGGYANAGTVASFYDVRIWAQAEAPLVIANGSAFAQQAMHGFPAGETARYCSGVDLLTGRDTSGHGNHLMPVAGGMPGPYFFPGNHRRQTRHAYGKRSGGTQFTQSLTGGITPAGVLVNSVGKPLTGGAGPSGAIILKTAKPLVGAITPAGIVIKRANKPLAGGITPTGIEAGIKVSLVPVGGGITPGAGTLVRRVSRLLTGGITPTGIISKLVTKTFTGGITPTGTLTTLKVILKSLTGGITPVATLQAFPKKVLTSAVASIQGSLVKGMRKALVGTVTNQGALAVVRKMNMVGGLTPSATTLELVKHRLSVGGTITSSGLLILGSRSIAVLYFSAKILPAMTLEAELRRAFSLDAELD